MPSRRRAREQQSRDVAARNQQDEPKEHHYDDRKQHELLRCASCERFTQGEHRRWPTKTLIHQRMKTFQISAPPCRRLLGLRRRTILLKSAKDREAVHVLSLCQSRQERLAERHVDVWLRERRHGLVASRQDA